ncbi:MAG: cytochrome c oxidase subunit II [Planctomycetota bacterium]
MIENILRLILPEAASSFAPEIDLVYFYIFAISVFFFVLIVGLTGYFCVVYARKDGDPIPPHITHNKYLETVWIVVPTVIVFIMFYWGARGYMDMVTPPSNARQVQVLAKRWDWTFTQTGGAKDSVLHVPVNEPVELVMTSVLDDVIHSLYVPAFRVKLDVVPGRYSKMWFKPTKIGTYDLYCTEFCGDGHSRMKTKVVVQSPEDFKAYLVQASKPSDPTDPEFVKRTVQQCMACHSTDGSVVVGPSFKGVWGKTESLEGGGSVVVDENYVRESLMEPNTKIVKGFKPGMVSYKGVLTEEEILAVIHFIKGLK